MSSTTSAPKFSVTYDRDSDVLYLSTRPGTPARSQEKQPGVIWRYDAERGDLIGVTIIDFASYWRSRQDELAKQIAIRFAVSRKAAQDVLNGVDRRQSGAPR